MARTNMQETQTPARRPSVFERLETEGTAVQPDAAPPNGEIIDKSNVLGTVAKFVATQFVGTKRTAKHIFSIPSMLGSKEPVMFALWGDAQLSALLRKIRPNDLVALTYDGKKPDTAGNDVHNWRSWLITSRGDELRSLVEECEQAYIGIRAAVDHAKRERAANFGKDPRNAEPPAHSDSDYTGW